MNCPTCSGDTIVLRADGNERRRECRGQCRQRFTTVEVLKVDHLRQQEAVEVVKEAAAKLAA